MRQPSVRLRATTAHRATLAKKSPFARLTACSLVIAGLVAYADRACSAEPPEPQFLVQKLDAALSTPESVHFQVESQSIWSIGPQAEKRSVQKQNSRLWRAGRFWKHALARGVYGWNQSRDPNYLYREYIVADHALSIELDGLNRPADGLVSILKSPNDFAGQIDPSYRAKATSEDLDWLRGSLKGAEFLFGDLACDSARLPEVLAQCELRVHEGQDLIDGQQTWVLEAESPKYGYYTVWIDPEANYLPRQIAIYKSDHNLVGDKPLDEHELYVDPNDPAPDSKITAIEVRVENTRIESIDGVYCLIAFDINGASSYESGSPFHRSVECRLTDFQPKPELTAADFQLTLQIPEGTKVGMGDVDGDYIWHNGEVLRIDGGQTPTA